MPSPTTENYLKTIYVLAERGGGDARVRTGDLAQELNVTPGTVTTMIRGLAKRELVQYESRKGVRLTEPGRVQALKVLRRHRLIELFLVEVMRMDWSEVHEDAEALEHAVSDTLVERMADMLGNPLHDPHGSPIPTRGSVMPPAAWTSMDQVAPGRYLITRVNDHDASSLEWMSSNGLKPGVEIELLSTDPRAGAVFLSVCNTDTQTALGIEVARRIGVEPIGV